MERIRYKKISETEKESVQTFNHATNGARYIVRITPSMWMVLDPETEVIAASGYISTKAKALIEVKETLTELGIKLSVEKRKPRTKRLV